jgi:uncharacterized membrane protein
MAGTLPRRPESPAAQGLRSLRRWYAVLLVGGTLGIVTAAWQTVDRIAWAADPSAGSVCEINKVLSCSSVFGHWQSSALGIPNSLVALPVFGVLAATGLAGLLGSVLARGYLATALAVNAGFALFITWYLEQSAFALGILCLFCLGCGVSAVVSGVGLTRAAAAEDALGTGRLGLELRRQVAAGADVVAWVGLALVWAAMLVVGLAF